MVVTMQRVVMLVREENVTVTALKHNFFACTSQIAERYQEVFSALAVMVGTQHSAASLLAEQLEEQRKSASKQVGPEV
jgi:hypothetical protein